MILVSGRPSFKRNSCMEKMKIYTLLEKVLNRMNLVSISETIGKKISERMAIGCNTRI